jgi:hypothetical protein
MLASDILDLTFFPVGSILMMDGSWTDGRGGWYICDGRATPHGNTPNLKDKFIRGGTASGTTGGADSNSVTLTADNLPSHNHGATGLSVSGLTLVPPSAAPLSISGLSLANMAISGLTATEGGSHYHTLSGGTNSENAHTHGVSITSGSSGGHAHTFPVSGGDNNDHDNTQYGSASFPTGGAAGLDSSTMTGTTTVSSQSDHTHAVSGTSAAGSAHLHSFTSESQAVAVTGHTHSVTGGTITGEITGGTISGGGLTGGSITGGSIDGSTANAGSSQAFTVDTVPVYYTMIYIKKMV